MTEQTEQLRPNHIEDYHLEFLDELREIGITNMYGAVPYLMDDFPDLSKGGARSILSYWMGTFGNEER